MFTTRNSRRLLGAVAVAGALTAIPLTVAGPASAAPRDGGPEVTEVKHGRDCDRANPWDDFLDNPFSDILDNRRGRHDDCDPWDRPGPWQPPEYRHHRPPGLFGSS